jgi:hypothetical protein
MATYLDGNVRRATRNTVLSMRRSAANRQCPKCGRKSALRSMTDDWGDEIVRIVWCRWREVKKDGLYPYCDYEKVRRF